MSLNKKDSSIYGSRAEAQRIYHQRNEIKRLQQENQQLKIQISAREEEYKKLENNWNELKKWLEENWEQSQDIWFIKIINKMYELEESE